MKNEARNPIKKGLFIRKRDVNQYEGAISEPAKEELNLNLELAIIAEEELERKEFKSKVSADVKPLYTETDQEAYYKKRERLKETLRQKPNALRYATEGKKRLLYVLIFFTMLSEFVIYQSIAENGFGIGEHKSYLIGFVAPLVTKYVAWCISRFIKDWVKTINIFRKNLLKIVAFVVVGLVFINVMSLSFVNLEKIKKENLIVKAERISDEIAEIEDEGYAIDITDLETELAEAQAKINKEDSAFVWFMKVLALMLISVLVVAAGAVLFVVANLIDDAIRLKKKIAELKDRLAHITAKYKSGKKAFSSLLEQRRELIRYYAKKQYLERLLTPIFKK